MKNPDGTPLHQKDVFAESMNVVAAGADTTVGHGAIMLSKPLN